MFKRREYVAVASHKLTGCHYRWVCTSRFGLVARFRCRMTVNQFGDHVTPGTYRFTRVD